MSDKYFFAVDLGATSGRTIVGGLTDGKIALEELTRFDNNLIEVNGHFYWDIYALYFEVVKGLKVARQRNIEISSIGIDTWGVDFVCVAEDGSVSQPLAYRDPHTFEAMDDYLQNVMPREKVYEITGIQFMNFNSIFQLHAMRRSGNSALKNARKILFIPDALSYMLTGKMVCEYTIASTAQLLNPRTKRLDPVLLESLGLTESHFGTMVNPGDTIGNLTPEIQKMTGLGAIPVVAVAGHDTASAVAAVPAKNERFAYLSSGTWSLMGIETKDAIINKVSYDRNFTNEGGIEDTTRFLKNICGMWLYERCRKEWTDAPKSHAELIAEAMLQPAFQSVINPDDAMFANPSSMVEAIQDYCRQTDQHIPEGYAEICRCIFDSLALRYRQVFSYLTEKADFPIDVLHIIGGGSLNTVLNQFTANSCGVEVLAGPQECTAFGNIMVQAKAAGEVKNLWEIRKVIANSIELRRFSPKDKEQWDAAYDRFLDILKSKGYMKSHFCYVRVCSDFSKDKPFATAFFSKVEENASMFASASMQNSLYTFGLVLRGFDKKIRNLFDEDEEKANELLTDFFKDEPTDEIKCYDITVLEVTNNEYKSVIFGEGDNEHKLETFHRAYMGSRAECLADLKRQFEQNKDIWNLEKA